MSKDQLSWDQLFAQKDSSQVSSSAPAPVTRADLTTDIASNASPDIATSKTTDFAPAIPSENLATAPLFPSEIESRKATPKVSRARAGDSSKSIAAKTSNSVPGTYAKKDWSKLEFESASTSTSATTDELGTSRVGAPTSRDPEIFSTPEPIVDKPADKSPHVYSISEINRGIRETLEGKFAVLWLKGEISNFKAHTSGHFYFSLKDSKAQISAVMFRGFNTGLRFRPEDGMEVLVRGKVTVYEPRGNYQIFCETMEPVGAGALQKAFEQLKNKLQLEGLFDESRKRPLPVLPRHIAIVTSPTGAAIRDMLNVLGRRFRGARVTVIPCKVQGEQAPGEIVRAIAMANQMSDVDVMIVGRGGGSIEDLWAFNEEKVARAIAATRVPVISAVGHEIDFTIADFVADLRAPTPSAAAELVVKNAADLMAQIAGLNRSLRMTMMRFLNQSQQTVHVFGRRLVDPQRRILEAAQRCDELVLRLSGAIQRGIQTREMRIAILVKHMGSPQAQLKFLTQQVRALLQRLISREDQKLRLRRELVSRHMAVLDSLSPLRVLDRGFSMVIHGDKIVTKASELKAGDQILVRMGHGQVAAEVKSIKTDSKSISK